MRLLQGSMWMGGGGRKGSGSSILIISLVMLIAGLVTWFCGTILQSTISRQREYLADACAVQFTRNPDGIANALRKIASIEQPHDMPKAGTAYSHLYFDHRSWFSTLFATHPPLEKRIAAIKGHTYLPSDWQPPAT
jgi:heat shock protein HtpX